MKQQPHILQGTLKAAGVKADDAPYGWVEGIANALIVDRYREVVLPEALMAAVAKFMLNPVLSIGHRIDADPAAGLPAGTVLKIWQEDGNTFFRARFANTPEAQKVRGLYNDGDMRAFSVQFIPRGSRDPNEEDILKWPNARVIVTELDLLEIACAVVPVNQGSLATASKSVSVQPMARPRGLAANQGANVAKQLSDKAKGHLQKVKGHYNDTVKSLTAVAESLDELADDPQDEDSISDPSEMVHRMGVHCDLAHRAMKAMKTAHKDLSDEMSISSDGADGADGGDGNDDGAGEDDAPMNEDETKQFEEQLAKALA